MYAEGSCPALEKLKLAAEAVPAKASTERPSVSRAIASPFMRFTLALIVLPYFQGQHVHDLKVWAINAGGTWPAFGCPIRHWRGPVGVWNRGRPMGASARARVAHNTTRTRKGGRSRRPKGTWNHARF